MTTAKNLALSSNYHSYTVTSAFREQTAGQLLYQAFQTQRYQSCIDEPRREIRLGYHLLYVQGLGAQTII
jgi:hypothetical protein